MRPRAVVALVAGAALAVAGTPMLSARAEAPVTESFTVVTPAGNVHVQVHRPSTSEPVPVVFSTSLFAGAADDALGTEVVGKGVARVVAHNPGTGQSTGCWDWGGPSDQGAIAAVVAEVVKKPWSNGRVAAYGVGVDAASTNALVAGKHPNVVTGVAVGGVASWYDYSFSGGIRRAGFGEDHTQNAEALLARTKPCDPVAYLNRARDTTPDHDAFWRDRNHVARAAIGGAVRVPVLVAHGYQDTGVKANQGVDLFQAVPLDDPATEPVEGAPYKRLVLGQWGAGTPTITEWRGLLGRWLDQFLLGTDTGITSEPRVQTQGIEGKDHACAEATGAALAPRVSGCAGGGLDHEGGVTAWAYGNQWPLDTSATNDLWLRRRPGKPGELDGSAPGNEPPATYVNTGKDAEDHSRHHPNLHEIEWLFYSSPTLTRDVRLTGPIVFDVWFSPGEQVTTGQIDAILVDYADHPLADTEDPAHVHPAITRGHLNIQYHDGTGMAKAPNPLSLYRATITFEATDYVVKAGSEIGLLIQGSNITWVEAEGAGQGISILHDGSRGRASVVRARSI